MRTRKHKPHIAHLLTVSLVWLILSADAAASDWFVRPAGGNYGSEDGSSYQNAWDGLPNVVWGPGGVEAGDTLYVCGLHLREYTEGSALKISPDSGTSENRITIRGDYLGDAGIVWGAGVIAHEAWADEGSDTWSITLPKNVGSMYVFEDVTADSWTVLTKVDSFADVQTTPGSYYSPDYDEDSRLYVHTSDSGSPTNRIAVNRIGYLMKVNERHYITWQNIKFYSMYRWLDALDGHYATNITWNNVTNWYGTAFHIDDYSHDIEIIDCDLGWQLGGILVIAKRDENDADPYNILISGCLIHDIGVGWDDSDSHAIVIGDVHNAVIERNEIYNAGSGITNYSFPLSRGMENVTLRWNYIHDMHMLGGANSRGIELNGANTIAIHSGVEVYGNIVANIEGVAYRVMWPGDKVVFYNNVAYNSAASFYFHHKYDPEKGPKITLKNNISMYPSSYHISFSYGDECDDYVIDSNYNIFYPVSGDDFAFNGGKTFEEWQALSKTGSTFDPNSIVADPLFVDPENGNFNLWSDSPAINAGVDVGLTQDFEGKLVPQGSAPDIGAYEYTLNAVTDLAALGTSQNSVTFSWTMPSDDGLASMPSRYDIRYATSLITEANWSTATQVQGEPAPEDFGIGRSFTISGLAPGTTYYFAIKTSNETGSTSSPLSNVISQTTATSGNFAPVLASIGDKSVENNELLTFTISATDADIGDTLTYSATDLPPDASFNETTHVFEWTPLDSQGGTYHVTFQVTDGSVAVTETIRIIVNEAPVLAAIGNKSVSEGSTLSFTISATDPDGQTLTYSVSGLPAGAVFAGQTFTWTPSYTQAGTYNVSFAASDGIAQDSETITITVVNVNRAPVLTAIGNKIAYADVLLSFSIDATDPDGDSVTYSAGTLPSGATFTGQDFSWMPTQGQVGSYNVTFAASDGQLQDSEMVTFTVDVDLLAPIVTNCLPAAGAIQVPLNNLITLNIADAGIGVDATSVKIKVRINDNPNNDTVYFGDTDHYTSPEGDCRRLGTKADYRFVYQPTSDMLYYDQTVTITVYATDLAGNVMDEYSYSFATEMHSFGQNKQVNSGLDNNDRPVTVCDSIGNIWTAWHAGSVGSRDIYVSKLAAGEENFSGTVQLTDNMTDQCNPAVALDSNDKLYVVWQDNREGDWDIYVSTSVDGISWSTETRVNDPNDGNQVNPAIVIDGQSPNQAHVVWQDDRAGNQDIFIATSSDGFATPTVSQQITSDSFDQVEPAVAADSDNTIYVVWTDGRNGSNDIYGAASNNPWTNVAVVSNTNSQSSPAIAAESTGSILHFLWVDDTPGDNDIYYASSNGLPGSPLTGSSIIDDSSGADQLDPSIVVAGSTDNNLKVFACWQDWRDADTDLYFAELSAGSGTNVFVDDGGSSANQGEPAIGISEYNHPYIMWADNRSTNTDIYYAGSTFIEPVALASELFTASASGSTTVGTDPQAITTVDDVSIIVPAGACLYDVAITVTKIANPLAFAAPCLGGYDFGPSGIQFSQPVTITIPYAFSSSDSSVTPYWFNSLTRALSQQGITDIQDIPISSSLHALSFKTTHFTAFYLLVGGGAAAIVGGGGGGCSVSASGEGNIVEFIIPYIVLAVVMVILKMRDIRDRKARNMTTGKY